VNETLTQIGARHDTNKTKRSRNRGAVTEIYEPYLAPRRDEELRVVEFGVRTGGSLRMWRDYFPRAQVIGVDIAPGAAEHAGDRIEVLVGDQKDPVLLDEIAARGPLDVVIDDGGHRAQDQQEPLLRLWPHLAPDGLYIVEDIHTSYKERYDMGLRRPGTTVELLKGLVDDVHQSQHGESATLAGLEFVHFYFTTCVLKRRGSRWGGLGTANGS
jgi:hypothetical protein